MYYFRIVNGRIVNTGLDFDTLQEECDAEMEGFVVSEADYTASKLEAIADQISRVEVIGAVEREFVKWDVNVRLSLQDEGRTLKVFLA